MNPVSEERLDYGDSGNGGFQKLQHQGSGTIPALADEEIMGEDDEYEDLYNDVNIGEGMFQFNQAEAAASSVALSSTGFQAQPSNISEPGRVEGEMKDLHNSAINIDNRYINPGVKFSEQKVDFVANKAPHSGAVNHLGAASISEKGTCDASHINTGVHHMVSIPATSGADQKAVAVSIDRSGAVESASIDHAGRIDVLSNRGLANGNSASSNVDNGMTTLFVGELHWWTTDAELEDVLSRYGNVKEIKFFDERASGKSKGYCQVEFADSASATACKEGMDGYIFNGRACVVAFASAQTLKQIGAAYVNKNQSQPSQNQALGRRSINEGSGRGGGTNYPAGDSGRNFGRGGRGGGRGSTNGGPGFGGLGGRGGQMVGKNSLTNLSVMGNGTVGNYGHGHGLPGTSFGGPANGMMHHPQAMMGPGFDPTFMGQGAGFGGFSGPSFPGMMPAFPTVNPMGLPGVSPHVNPAFFNRGMTPHGMGVMGAGGMDGFHGTMWGAGDPSTGGWGGKDYGRGQRMRESSYGGDDGASRYGYGEMNPEKGGRSNSHETERTSQRDWPQGNSDRIHRNETGQGSDRGDRGHRYRDEKDEDLPSKEYDTSYEDDWDRGVSSSRSRSRSRVVAEDDHRSRSRDIEYGKKRRIPE